jgi:hypothetical protein
LIKPNRRRVGAALRIRGASQLLVATVAHGPVAGALQAQNHACSARTAFHSTGENPVPLCEPSQNGWLFERPHAHHQ